MSIGNDVVSSDFLKVLLALKDNIMRDLHCNDIGIVVSTSGNECVCKLLSNPDIKISCTKINNIITDKDDVVFIAYTDINSKHNAKQLSDQKDLRNQTIGNKHAYENAVIVLNYSKQGSGEGVTVDSALSSTSTNPVQNKVLYNPVEFAESERQKSKNLFNTEAVPITSSYVTYDKDTNTFTYTVNSTIESASTSFAILKYGKLKPGTYTMSFNTTSTIGNTAPVIVAKLNEYDNFSTSIATKNIIDGYVYLTFTLTEETNIGLAWYYKAGWIAGDAPPGVKTLTNLQLEEGSIATDYQSYNGAIVHEKNIFGASTLTLIYSKNTTDPNLNKGKTNGIDETSGAVSIDFNEYDFALCKIRSDQANHDYTASLFMLIPLKYGVGVAGNYTGCISVENPYNVIRRNTAKIEMVSIFATIPTTKDSISIFTTYHNEEQTPTFYENMAIDDIWGVKLL